MIWDLFEWTIKKTKFVRSILSCFQCRLSLLLFSWTRISNLSLLLKVLLDQLEAKLAKICLISMTLLLETSKETFDKILPDEFFFRKFTPLNRGPPIANLFHFGVEILHWLILVEQFDTVRLVCLEESHAAMLKSGPFNVWVKIRLFFVMLCSFDQILSRGVFSCSWRRSRWDWNLWFLLLSNCLHFCYWGWLGYLISGYNFLWHFGLVFFN